MAGYSPYGGYSGYGGYGGYGNSGMSPYSVGNNANYLNNSATMGMMGQNPGASMPYGGNMGQQNMAPMPNNAQMPMNGGMMQNQPQTVFQSNPTPVQQQAIATTSQQTPQQPMNNTIQMNPIQGISNQSRVVGSKTEAESVPADFLGAPIIMPMLVNGEVAAIYVKQWDVNRGQANFGEFYKLQDNNVKVQPQSSATPTQNAPVNQPVQQEVQPSMFATVENVHSMQNIMNNMQDTINYLQDEVYRLKSQNRDMPMREDRMSERRSTPNRTQYPPEPYEESYDYEYEADRPHDRRYEKRYSEQQDGRSSLVEREEIREEEEVVLPETVKVETEEAQEVQEERFSCNLETQKEPNEEVVVEQEKPSNKPQNAKQDVLKEKRKKQVDTSPKQRRVAKNKEEPANTENLNIEVTKNDEQSDDG